VASEGGDLAGSALGVVIDARGRPLALAQTSAQRRARLWEWLVALGVERGESPYLAQEGSSEPISEPLAEPIPVSEPVSEPLTNPPPLDAGKPSAAVGRRISLDELRAEEAERDAVPASGGDSSLDALRQSVEEPKRRGWFRRK
jgi:hypothetical protein